TAAKSQDATSAQAAPATSARAAPAGTAPAAPATSAQATPDATSAQSAPAPAPPPAAQGLPTPAGLNTLASPAPSPPPPSGGGAFAALRQCESGGNYSADTGNGYYGAYQFSAATWHGLGYAGLPSQASPPTQDQAAARLQSRGGWSQWPACSSMLGL
ncbi:MAG: transglycosylase family protein, partial [Acidimicrobiales bacterium]